MKFKPYWSVLPLITVVTAALGTYFSSNGMDWYNTALVRPELTPDKWAFPVAWTTIYILTTCSALIVWNRAPRNAHFRATMSLFLANAFLNMLWSVLFFGLHQVQWALYEMIALEATVLALMVMTFKVSKTASALLLPYAAWVGFATFLTYQVSQLN